MSTHTVSALPEDAFSELSASDSERIERAAAGIEVTDPADVIEPAAQLALEPLSVFEQLRAVVRTGLPSGATVISGFPVDVLDGARKDGWVSELALLAVGSVLGTPIGYAVQRDGRIIHDLRPIREHAGEQLGTGSVELTWHTEEAHTDLAPRFILLLCLRGDAEAATLVSRPRPELLPASLRARLEVADFEVGSDASHAAASGRRCAVLTPHRLTLDPLFTRCADSAAQAAFDALSEQVDGYAQQVVLGRGDLMVIDNFVCAHARSAYSPRYDNGDRWLQRTVVLEQPPAPEMTVPGRRNVVVS